MKRHLVDSCGWLEYFADGPNATFFAPGVEDTKHLLVPTIVIHEVFKKLLSAKGEAVALQVAAHMSQGEVVDLDRSIALAAATLGVELGLPLADSVILATGYAYDAVIWTQDADFKEIKGIRYKERR